MKFSILFFFPKIQVMASTPFTPSTSAATPSTSAATPSTSAYYTRASPIQRATDDPPYLAWEKQQDTPPENNFSCYSRMDAPSLTRIFPGIYVNGNLVQFR